MQDYPLGAVTDTPTICTTKPQTGPTASATIARGTSGAGIRNAKLTVTAAATTQPPR